MEESDLTSNANVTFLGNSADVGGGMYAINSNMKFMRFTQIGLMVEEAFT